MMVVPAVASGLIAFTHLIGSCWAADFSPTVRDVHCFEAIYDGAHVRDRHEVKDNGKTVYAGETIYSRDGSDTLFTYFNSLGGAGRGSVRTEGSKLRFAGTMRASPDKPQQRIDSEWTVDADGYAVRSLVEDNSVGANAVLRFTKVK